MPSELSVRVWNTSSSLGSGGDQRCTVLVMVQVRSDAGSDDQSCWYLRDYGAFVFDFEREAPVGEHEGIRAHVVTR